MNRQRASGAFIVINALMMWAAFAVATIAVWPIYQDLRLILLVAVTTVAGTLVGILGAVFRWKSAIVVLVSLGVFLALGVPLAVPDATIAGVLPTVDGFRQLLAGSALGWKQLVTITLPVGSYQALLVPAFTVTLVASVAGTTAALRWRLGDLAVLAPVSLFVFGIVFGPDYSRFPRVASLSLLAILLGWLVWRRWYRRRVAIAQLTAATTDVGGAPAAASADHRIFGVRTVASGAVIVVVAAVASIAMTAAVPPTGSRQVLRSAVEQPFDPRAYASPLVGFRGYLDGAAATSVILSVSGLPEGALLRVATLDTYDGIVYSVGSDVVDSASGSFTRVPYRFDQSAVDGTDVTLDVTVGDYAGVWVPTVGQLETVQFDGSDAAALRDSFYYNDNSGTGAVLAGLTAGDSYQLSARIPVQPSREQLATVTAGSASVPAVGIVPDELDVALSGYVASATGQGEQLLAMLDGLARDGYVSHGLTDEVASRSGHSADRITELLTDQLKVGDAEQYAVTAALMARQLGFPARVVFGFAPTVSADGVTEVTGSSVSAWIEVNTSQYGWVSIDPTPPPGPIPTPEQDEPSIVARPPSVVQPSVDDPPTTQEQSPPESTQDTQTGLPAWLLVVLFIARILAFVLLGAGILLSPFLAVIAAKVRRRRRRRHAATPVLRISGGWQEYRDAVIDHGFEPPASATRSEVAETAGGAQAAVLAAVADRAAFAPEIASDLEAERVWRAVEELRSSLDRGMTRWERIRADVSLRSFSDSRLLRFIAGRGGDR
jgi:hypothetical protein